MTDKELRDLQYNMYKKHGNSCNGAQLTLMYYELKYMKELYSNDEIANMINEDFYKYFKLSGEILKKHGWKV